MMLKIHSRVNCFDKPSPRNKNSNRNSSFDLDDFCLTCYARNHLTGSLIRNMEMPMVTLFRLLSKIKLISVQGIPTIGTTVE